MQLMLRGRKAALKYLTCSSRSIINSFATESSLPTPVDDIQLPIIYCQPKCTGERPEERMNGACSVLSMGMLAIYILSAADTYLLCQLALNERDLQALRWFAQNR